MRKIIGIVLFCIVLVFILVIHELNLKGDSGLLKPTGSYGIGYQDVSLVNTTLCPDKFHIPNTNENDFSAENTKHCHEVMLRVYYPSQQKLSLGDRYYAPFMADMITWLVSTVHLSQSETHLLNSILNVRTYAHANVKPVVNKKFPVVIFMSGSGQPAQNYNNIISDLVSHGYIVIGINSVFINGALALSNEHIVLPPKSYFDRDGQITSLQDLKFTLSHLRTINYKDDLAQHMSFNEVGLIGHSRGAMTVVHFLEQSKEARGNFKAIILMDPENMQGQTKYPLPRFIMPTMTIWSSYYKNSRHATVTLGKNDCEVILVPDIKNEHYSNHENFSDFSTLQYHPAFLIPKIHNFLMDLSNEQIGTGDGYEIAKVINNHVLSFFNTYLGEGNHESGFYKEKH